MLHFIHRHDNRVDLHCFDNKTAASHEDDLSDMKQVQLSVPNEQTTYDHRGKTRTVPEMINLMVASGEFTHETAALNLAHLNVGEYLVLDLPFACTDKATRVS